MTEGDPQFKLLEFEQVEAAPGTALLRLAGRAATSVGSGSLTLITADSRGEHRHEQLPALPGPPGLIRAAFSAPLEDTGPDSTYTLALPDGTLVTLPAPTRRPNLTPAPSESDTPAATPDAGAQSEPSRLVEAERRAESRRLAITELEHRLQAEREQRSAAESDLAHVRAEREEARAERDASMAERDDAIADRDQAEARARAAAANAGALEAQVRAATDTATRAQNALETQLGDRSAEFERLRTAAELAHARAHASRREATELDEQLAHAQAQITVLQQTLDEREAERQSMAAAHERDLSAARADTVAAREQVIALEEELAAQRDIASRSGTAHTQELETAQARLDVAQAELDGAQSGDEALRHRNEDLQATLADRDATLAARAAEIDLLHAQADEHGSALKAEIDKRLRAENALIAATARQALTRDSLALAAEASRRNS